MSINFEKAKKVAASCLAMTSCGFMLWLVQNDAQASAQNNSTTPTEETVIANNINNNDQTNDQRSQATAQPASQFNTQNNQDNQNAQASVNGQSKLAAANTNDTQNYDRNDHGNYAYLDSAKINDQGQLSLSGWHATNGAKVRKYHYIIAYDQTNHREITRQKVVPVIRTDIPRVHNVYGANESGFKLTLNLGNAMAQTNAVTVISRYTNDAQGNGDYVDYWFPPITIDQHNYAYLDSAQVINNQLRLAGWNATNQAATKANHYIILIDRTEGSRELGRQLVTNGKARPDVVKVYPDIDQAANSGFNVSFDLSKINLGHQIQVISRYSDQTNGEGHYTDYYFAPITTGNYANQGYLDSFDLRSGKVSGWHANDISKFETNHFLILFDQTTHQQVAMIKATQQLRPDVAKAYPSIATANNSGFSGQFTNLSLVAGNRYSLVSRYSTSASGNGDRGQYTDYWFAPQTFKNQEAYYLDSVQMTAQGLHLTGWMIDDESFVKPNAYAIVLNNGKEVARQRLTLVARPDVAKAYPGVYNSNKSGFNTTVSFDPVLITGKLQVILRFVGSDPNRNYDDQTSNAYLSNTGWFDRVNVNGSTMTISGWHATDQANSQKYQYLIFVGPKGELYRHQVTDGNIARTDVGQAYPYILNSNQAGYQLSFAIPDNMWGQTIRIVHRYTNDPVGNGSSPADYWSAPITVSTKPVNPNHPVSPNRPNQFAVTDAAVQQQRSLIAAAIARGLGNKGTVDYDWNNQNDNFAAFSVHDTAQLLAVKQKNTLDQAAGTKLEGNQGLDPDAKLVEKNLAKNTLLTGDIQNIFTKNYYVSSFSDQDSYINQVIKDYLNQLKLTNVNGDILGIGSSYDQTTNQLVVTGILFKKGPVAPQPAQATSTVLNATVTNVYFGKGVKQTVTVNNSLKDGATVNNAELNNALSGINHTILTGNRGEVIPQSILQLYYDALVGAEGDPNGSTTAKGISGQSSHIGNDGGTYHYVYWLRADKGNVQNNPWQIFMDNNRGVKYGDPIKIELTATLAWGNPDGKPVSGVPTSQMSNSEITTAYATGSDSGASHEAVHVEPITNFNNNLARGVDVGSLIALEQAGVTFYNFNGQPDDLFNILQQAGINYIRLRLWNDPYNAANQTYGGGNSDEATLIKLAQRAKAHNMKVLMDFHYSDFWADPATQYLPKAWQGEDPATLQQSVYDYTKKVLLDLKATGADVEMVQVGNEITRGILTPKTDKKFWFNPQTADNACRYLSAGSRAVREVFPNAKVLLHLEGMNQSNYRRIMNVWRSHNVDYDALATSAYPFWTWAGKVDGHTYTVRDTINGVINMVKSQFGKQVLLTETSWPYTTENADGTNNTKSDAGHATYSIDPQGQVDAMESLYKDMSNDNGEVMGAFWWEPAWIPAKAGWNYYQYNIDAGDALGTGWASSASLGYYPDSKLYYNGKPTWGGSSWENQALFDDNGYPLQSLKMFSNFAKGYTSPTQTPSKPTTQVISPIQLKVSQVYSNGKNVNTPLTVGSIVPSNDVDSLVDTTMTNLLTGNSSDIISKDTLHKLADNLAHALNGNKVYTDANGKKYHYVFWLDGQTISDKEWQVANGNQNIKYGSLLTLPVNATLTAN